jgi:hypothetical protein
MQGQTWAATGMGTLLGATVIAVIWAVSMLVQRSMWKTANKPVVAPAPAPMTASEAPTTMLPFVDANAPTQHFVVRHGRAHGSAGRFWDTDTFPTIVDEMPRNHWATINQPWREREHTELPHTPSRGRHSVHNPARHIVPRDWMPAIGATRIRLALSDTGSFSRSEQRELRRELAFT